METNALIALLRRFAPTKESASSIAAIVAKLGVRGVVLLARGYLGPLAARAVVTNDNAREAGRFATTDGNGATRTSTGGLEPGDLAVLGLAFTKLLFEVGELALRNPGVDAERPLPAFTLDENGYAPAMSLAHVVAANRVWSSYKAERETTKVGARQAKVAIAAPATPRARLYAARSEYYSTTPRFTYAATARPATLAPKVYNATISRSPVSRGTTMATPRTPSRGCASCGGASRPAPQPTPTYDPCANALPPVSRPPEAGCGCGCSCGKSGGSCGCKTEAPTKTYDRELCPTFAISCETKTALRDCVKTALCDFLRCMGDTLCPDGRFDINRFQSGDSESDKQAQKQLQTDLINCVGQLACSFMHCLPDALCPPTCEQPATPIDCVPCDYAVEVVR